MGNGATELGVNIPFMPPMRGPFSYGVGFKKSILRDSFAPNHSYFDPSREEDADVLVLEPGEFDNQDELVVVVVNQRCLQNENFRRWLKTKLGGGDGEGPSYARVFIPESRAGAKGAVRMTRKWLDRSVNADAFSYYPVLVK